MALETKHVGSQAEMVEFLKGLAEERGGFAAGVKDSKDPLKARHAGVAEGLEIAAQHIERWELPNGRPTTPGSSY